MTVTFDKPVTVSGSPEVALSIGSRTRQAAFSSPSATGVTTLMFHYPVQASDRDADGIAIPANAIRRNGAAITDADDDTVDARLFHAAVSADAARKVDGGQVSAPAVTAVSFSGAPASGDTYELGETVRVRVAFDKAVTVTGSPRIEVTIGSQTHPAAFSAGSAGQVLTFAYTVQTQDADADGISIAANAIRLAGGTITAAVDPGTAANLTHAAVATDPNRKVAGSRVTAPAVSAIAFAGHPAGAGTYVRGETIRVQVRFNRAVTVSGSPRVALLIGSATRTAAFAAADSTATALHFAYTVQAADLDEDGISIAADAISLDGGSVKAGDGVTDADLSHAAVAADATRKVDGRITGPVVSGIAFITTPLSGATFQRGENIDVRVEFNQPIGYIGDPSVELTIGSRTRPATLAYVPGPTALVFRYIVQAGDLDADGVSIAANAIRLGGGSIKAADGVTDAILAHAPVAADRGRRVNGNQVTAPAVSRISFVGSPADGTTYQLGETIEVKVEFDRYVRSSGGMRLALTIGGQTRLARFSHGRGFGGITDLHFKYVVQETDFDANGVSIGADAIRLNGGSITTADGRHRRRAEPRGAARRRHPQRGRHPGRRSGGHQHLLRRGSGQRRRLPARREDQGQRVLRPPGDGQRQSRVGADHRQPDRAGHTLQLRPGRPRPGIRIPGAGTRRRRGRRQHRGRRHPPQRRQHHRHRRHHRGAADPRRGRRRPYPQGGPGAGGYHGDGREQPVRQHGTGRRRYLRARRNHRSAGGVQSQGHGDRYAAGGAGHRRPDQGGTLLGHQLRPYAWSSGTRSRPPTWTATGSASRPMPSGSPAAASRRPTASPTPC